MFSKKPWILNLKNLAFYSGIIIILNCPILLFWKIGKAKDISDYLERIEKEKFIGVSKRLVEKESQKITKNMPITLTRQNNEVVTTTDLTKTVEDLSSGLQAIKPNNSETTQIITYALVATAVVGIFVYHYIKQQENLD